MMVGKRRFRRPCARCWSDLLRDETTIWRIPLPHQNTIPMNRGMATDYPVECAYLSEDRIITQSTTNSEVETWPHWISVICIMWYHGRLNHCFFHFCQIWKQSNLLNFIYGMSRFNDRFYRNKINWHVEMKSISFFFVTNVVKNTGNYKYTVKLYFIGEKEERCCSSYYPLFFPFSPIILKE